jgi:hypothetical protein
LPLDEDLLERLFGDEVRDGVISHPLDIGDAWKNSYSCSTNHKVWAAKFTARHPNLVALEISSFKCGHDAPIYGVIEGIIEQSGTPYFCFKDLDENKPSGSIKIRVETIDYFLRRYREEVIRKRKAVEEVEAQLAEYENQLRGQMERAAQGLPALRKSRSQCQALSANAGPLEPSRSLPGRQLRYDPKKSNHWLRHRSPAKKEIPDCAKSRLVARAAPPMPA